MYTLTAVSDKEQKGSIMGFKPIEVFRKLWNEDNPCLFMAKYIQY